MKWPRDYVWNRDEEQELRKNTKIYRGWVKEYWLVQGTGQQGNEKTKGMYHPRSNEKVPSAIEHMSNLKT